MTTIYSFLRSAIIIDMHYECPSIFCACVGDVLLFLWMKVEGYISYCTRVSRSISFGFMNSALWVVLSCDTVILERISIITRCWLILSLDCLLSRLFVIFDKTFLLSFCNFFIPAIYLACSYYITWSTSISYILIKYKEYCGFKFHNFNGSHFEKWSTTISWNLKLHFKC